MDENGTPLVTLMTGAGLSEEEGDEKEVKGVYSAVTTEAIVKDRNISPQLAKRDKTPPLNATSTKHTHTDESFTV